MQVKLFYKSRMKQSKLKEKLYFLTWMIRNLNPNQDLDQRVKKGKEVLSVTVEDQDLMITKIWEQNLDWLRNIIVMTREALTNIEMIENKEETMEDLVIIGE
jgi:hypothetical protein